MDLLAFYVVAGNAGIMLFFTVAVAPFIFKVLPAEWAGRYVRSFFPRYYAFLFATSVIPAVLLHGQWAGQINAVVAALFLFNWLVLTPAVNRATDAGAKQRFMVLHLLSIAINFVQLGLLLWVLHAVRPVLALAPA